MKKIIFCICALVLCSFFLKSHACAHEDEIVVSPEQWKAATDQAPEGYNWQRAEELGTSAAFEAGISGENKFPKRIPASDLKRTDGTHPAFMKMFAEWAHDFFEKEPLLREKARDIATRYSNKKDKQYLGDYIVELYQVGGIDVTADTHEHDIEGQLDYDERQVYDTSLKGIAFYLAGLLGEEAVKTGSIPPPSQNESETPEVIKNYIIGMLSPYRSGRIKSKEEIIKEIKSTWDNMRNALQAGDIERALTYFSESTKDSYRKSFQALKEKGLLSKVVSGMGDMQVVNVDISHAEGDMRVKENGKELSFFVKFQPEGEGIWKIVSY